MKLLGIKSLNCLNFLLCIAAAYSEPAESLRGSFSCNQFSEKCSIVDVQFGSKYTSVKEKKKILKQTI